LISHWWRRLRSAIGSQCSQSVAGRSSASPYSVRSADAVGSTMVMVRRGFDGARMFEL
jgi:hypothetical protein